MIKTENPIDLKSRAILPDQTLIFWFLYLITQSDEQKEVDVSSGVPRILLEPLGPLFFGIKEGRIQITGFTHTHV